MKLEKLPAEFRQALPILNKLQLAGFEAYFVGGCVRDALLQRQIHDVDIATSAYPAEVKAIFPRTIDVGIEHGTVLVLLGKTEAEHYEVTTFRTESDYTDYRRPDHVNFVRKLDEDLQRRDFTVNALACGAAGEIIDLFDGLADLSNKRLRAVGRAEERFKEDALRIMRAMRFAASLNFEIEEETFAAMKSHAHLLQKISVERIFIEMDKLLLAADWKKGLSALIESEAGQFLPSFGKLDLANLSDDFAFKSSAQAWTWLNLQFDRHLNLKKWKVANDLRDGVAQLTAAYQQSDWTLSCLYDYGLEACQLVDDLKIAQGMAVNPEQARELNDQLQIHDKAELVVKGADLMAIGFQAGPDLGKMLKLIEKKVVNNELKNDKTTILDFVKERND